MARWGGTATRAWGTALAVAVAVLDEVSPVAAQTPAPPSMLDQIHITLDYHGAPGCKEGEVFQHALSFHLYRWDVWAPPAPWRLVLTVTTKDDGFAGEAVLWDPTHHVRWGRSVDGPASCVDVLKDVALNLGLALDPSLVVPASGQASPPPAVPAAESKPAPPTPQELPPPDPVPPPPPAPAKPARSWRVAALVGVETRPATKPALGLVADVGGGISLFSFAARFHAVPSAADHVGGVSSLFAGGIVACLRSQLGALPLVVAGCALGEGGQIRHSVPVGSGSPSGGPFGSPGAGLFGDFGGRAEVELTITPTVYLRVGGELVGIAAQRNLYSGIVPAGAGSGGLGVAF